MHQHNMDIHTSSRGCIQRHPTISTVTFSKGKGEGAARREGEPLSSMCHALGPTTHKLWHGADAWPCSLEPSTRSSNFCLQSLSPGPATDAADPRETPRPTLHSSACAVAHLWTLWLCPLRGLLTGRARPQSGSRRGHRREAACTTTYLRNTV